MFVPPLSSVDLTPVPIPAEALHVAAYHVRFAHSDADVEAVLRLRYDVFTRELGRGDHDATGREADAFDPVCHHLMLCDARSGAVVGTYRLQTSETARRALGYYADTEFDLPALGPHVLNEAVEIGRACIAREHRSLKALHALWQGLGLYLRHTGKRYLFGCSSLMSQNPADGWAVLRALAARNQLHPDRLVAPRPAFVCPPPEPGPPEGPGGGAVPPLMRAYLGLGAVVCSLPALDRTFRTIDYLTLLDTNRLDPRTRRYFRIDPPTAAA